MQLIVLHLNGFRNPRAPLKRNFKCVCITIAMSLFSRDYIKTERKYQQCFNLLTSVQYSHSAWFLDGRTSILVIGNTHDRNAVIVVSFRIFCLHQIFSIQVIDKPLHWLVTWFICYYIFSADIEQCYILPTSTS